MMCFLFADYVTPTLLLLSGYLRTHSENRKLSGAMRIRTTALALIAEPLARVRSCIRSEICAAKAVAHGLAEWKCGKTENGLGLGELKMRVKDPWECEISSG